MAASYYCAACMNTFLRDAEGCPNLACRAERPDAGWGVVLGDGDTLDRHYAIERVLAVGGAGITYLAHRVDDAGTRYPPPVAIKVLFHNRDTGSYLRRLSVEAQVLRELDHPHIVQCLGFVHRLGESPYLVTRFERGGDLLGAATRLGLGDVARSLAIVRQVLHALHTAHQHGIVHRDLKPENVLLEDPVRPGIVPRIRVTDFGVAKVMTARAGFTRVGAFIGTPEYAAPEQFVGEPATPATDVFAAGGLLHFLLTHRTAVRFTDRTDFPRCYRELVEGCPPDLTGVQGDPGLIERCRTLLDGMMHVESRERWVPKDALAILDNLDLPPLPEPRDNTIAPIPRTRPAVPRQEPAPAFTGTIIPEAPVRPDEVRPLMDLDDGGADLTLDDLFAFGKPAAAPPPDPAAVTGGPQTPTDPRPRLHTPAPPPDIGRVPPRERRLGRPPPRPPVDMLGTFDGTAAARGPLPTAIGPDLAAPRQRATPLPLHDDGTLWGPDDPAALARPLPDTPLGVVAVLGQVAPTDRAEVLEALDAMDDAGVARALRAGVRSADLAIRRGMPLAVAGLQRSELAGAVRGLASDRDPTVRCLAVHALGMVGRSGALTTLSRSLTDDDALVRAAAALAIARAARAAGRTPMARSWLERAERDPDPLVASAIHTAKEWLG